MVEEDDDDEFFAALPRAGTKQFQSLINFCDANSRLLLAMLPWAAAEIAGNDGFPAMVRFVSCWGGIRFYVPRGYQDFLVKVGEPLSPLTHRRLRRGSAPSGLIDIPSAWGIFLVLRRAAIDAAMAATPDPKLIARRFGVTEKSLRR